jgi:ribosomal protein L12E/L44/L45/RPP1/RPP2
LLGLKKDADGDLTVLKSILHDADIQIKPIHARTFLNALNDLN